MGKKIVSVTVHSAAGSQMRVDGSFEAKYNINDPIAVAHERAKYAPEIINESQRKKTSHGRAANIEKAQARDEILVKALREIEKTIPLKAGEKYIKDNVRPHLLGHLPPGCRLPSVSKLKNIVSRMKRGLF
jgi:hypothetical protein